MTLHQEQEVGTHERSRSLTTARSPLDDQAVAAGNLGEEAKEARRAHHITTAFVQTSSDTTKEVMALTNALFHAKY